MTAMRFSTALFSLLALVGCGGATATSNVESSGATQPTSTSGGGAQTPPETVRGRSAPMLAALRPDSVTAILTGLDRDPEDPAIYARAAIAYADTDFPAMTLVYGQIYRILATHGPRTVDTTNAMARVLREKVVTDSGSTTVRWNIAQGEMPLIPTRGGGQLAPFVYLYEHSMSHTTGLSSTSRSTYEGAAAVFVAELGAVCRGGEPVLPDAFYETLCGMWSAGHSATYAHWVIGPAFAVEFEAYSRAHATEVNNLSTYLAAHPYRPRTPTRADDLYAVSGGT